MSKNSQTRFAENSYLRSVSKYGCTTILFEQNLNPRPPSNFLRGSQTRDSQFFLIWRRNIRLECWNILFASSSRFNYERNSRGGGGEFDNLAEISRAGFGDNKRLHGAAAWGRRSVAENRARIWGGGRREALHSKWRLYTNEGADKVEVVPRNRYNPLEPDAYGAGR